MKSGYRPLTEQVEPGLSLDTMSGSKALGQLSELVSVNTGGQQPTFFLQFSNYSGLASSRAVGLQKYNEMKKKGKKREKVSDLTKWIIYDLDISPPIAKKGKKDIWEKVRKGRRSHIKKSQQQGEGRGGRESKGRQLFLLERIQSVK